MLAKETRLIGRDYPFDATVRVTRADELTGDLRSDVVYIIDGVIDMGAAQITVPEGGLSLHGFDFSVSGLTTSQASHTLFITPSGGYAGDLLMRGMFVTVSGAGSQVFNLDNQENGGTVECTDFNFVSCTSLGALCAYRQLLWDDFALIACADGVTMDGTWSGGAAIVTSIIVSAGTPFTGTILKAGGTLVVNGSIRSDMNALQLDDAGAISDFAPANITNSAEFRMIGVRCNANATPFPNMPATNVKARYSNCVGFRNTYVGGQWAITSEAATTINTVGVPEKMAGTTTYADLNHMSQTVDNAFVYDGDTPIGTEMHMHIGVTGASNDEVTLLARHWVDSSSSYVDLAESARVTLPTGGRSTQISLQAYCDFEKNDRFEVWLVNYSGTSSITAKEGAIVSISERPS